MQLSPKILVVEEGTNRLADEKKTPAGLYALETLVEAVAIRSSRACARRGKIVGVRFLHGRLLVPLEYTHEQ